MRGVVPVALISLGNGQPYKAIPCFASIFNRSICLKPETSRLSKLSNGLFTLDSAAIYSELVST